MYIKDCRKLILERIESDFFKPNPWRLYIITVCFFCAILIYYAISYFDNDMILFFLSIFLGRINASMAFFSHELLHGAVIKSRRYQDILGVFSYLPFLLPPTLWRFWHNKLHHINTQKPILDPDCYLRLSDYNKSRLVRFMYYLAPGSRTAVSYLYLFYWFSFQTFFHFSYSRFNLPIWKGINNKRVNVEFSIQLAVYVSLLVFFKSKLIYVLLIPLCVQNYILMSYIATNHNISPLVDGKETLRNTLSIKSRPLSSFLDLNFGLHTEHHIFPKISGDKLLKIQNILIDEFSDNYKFIKKYDALMYVFKTPRIYKSAKVLIDPGTGRETIFE